MSDAMIPNDGMPSLQDAARALAGSRGRGVRIAVLDSGVEAGHPLLKELRLAEFLKPHPAGIGWKVGEAAPSDVYGHGTAVTGVIHRLAPEAEVGVFQVLNAENRAPSDAIRAAALAAIERGYHILNCSIGTRGIAGLIFTHKDWTDAAYLADRHVVAACSNRAYSDPEWPAHLSSVVAVDRGDIQDEAFFRREGALVRFVAPGENIRVAWRGGGEKIDTGSSFAAPFMTAMIARILSAHPEVSPNQMHDLLRRLAKPWQDGGPTPPPLS